MTIFKSCAARDFTVVDDGLQFTTSKNLQDRHKCSSENIANPACFAISHCILKIMANRRWQSTIPDHRLSSLVILSIKNEGALSVYTLSVCYRRFCTLRSPKS
jgi:hypothetical protein